MNCDCKKMTKSLAQMSKDANKRETVVVEMPGAPSPINALSERYLNIINTPNSMRNFGKSSPLVTNSTQKFP
ncbi:hypothetical protein L596_023087 [Steinernema carpocapsae]|uniref:Uncharacterized protein n=1 Tax=Steinernema carpocapsae TaxID=34508 RepID=A0A4U5MDE4_STECR|nr:hypothetical protein L596_023087 [Steinernema carpocapsae]